MKFMEKIKEYFRVLKVAKKPEKDDMKSTLRNSLIGIGIIGLIGFIFYLITIILEKALA
jgi:protein translocase SEC61 complex gamma subunit